MLKKRLLFRTILLFALTTPAMAQDDLVSLSNIGQEAQIYAESNNVSVDEAERRIRIMSNISFIQEQISEAVGRVT